MTKAMILDDMKTRVKDSAKSPSLHELSLDDVERAFQTSSDSDASHDWDQPLPVFPDSDGHVGTRTQSPGSAAIVWDLIELLHLPPFRLGANKEKRSRLVTRQRKVHGVCVH